MQREDAWVNRIKELNEYEDYDEEEDEDLEKTLEGLQAEAKTFAKEDNSNNASKSSLGSLSPSLKSMQELPLADMFYTDVVQPVMEHDELLPSTRALIQQNIIPDPGQQEFRSGIPKAKAKAKA